MFVTLVPQDDKKLAAELGLRVVGVQVRAYDSRGSIALTFQQSIFAQKSRGLCQVCFKIHFLKDNKVTFYEI